MQERNLPGKDGQTLWEGEEVALRFMLEDGKLNLCLRMLDDYSRCALLGHDTGLAADLGMGAVLASGNTAVPLSVTSRDALEACEKFEVGVCKTLHNVWAHPEAAQTTDLPLLAELLGRTFAAGDAASVLWYAGPSDPAAGSAPSEAAAEGKSSGSALQSSVPAADSLVGKAMVFLADMGLQVDALKLQMEGFVKQLLRFNVLGGWVAVMLANPHNLPDSTLLASAQGVAALVGSEDFELQRSAFLEAPLPAQRGPRLGGEAAPDLPADVAAGLVALGDGTLKRIAPAYADKRSIRPLLDLAALCKRRAGRAARK